VAESIYGTTHEFYQMVNSVYSPKSSTSQGSTNVSPMTARNVWPWERNRGAIVTSIDTPEKQK